MKTQTFKDFFAECENYQYSAEHFELMKECSELMLQAQYLENQQFLAENADVVSDENISFTEGFFTESADETIVEAINQQFTEKANGVWNTIKNGFLRIIKTIRNFFVRIKNKFDDDTKAINDLRKSFTENAGKMSADTVKSVLTSCAAKTKFKAKENQPYARRLKVPTEMKNVLGKDGMDLLACLLSNDYVYAYSDYNKDSESAPISMKRMQKIFKQVNGDSFDIKSAGKQLDDAINEAWNRGIEIGVNGEKLSEIIKELESIEKNITEAGDKFRTENPLDKSPQTFNAQEKREDAERINGMNGIYTRLQNVVSKTCAVYTSLANFRHQAAQELNKWINSQGKAPKNPTPDSQANDRD